MPKKKKRTVFPATLYVTNDATGALATLLVMHETLDTLDASVPVAVYRRVDIGQVTVRRTYEPSTGK